MAVFICYVPFSVSAESIKLPMVPAENGGMDSAVLAQIDAVVAEGIDDNKMPGCVVAIGRHGKLVFRKAFGQRRVEDGAEAMTVDTLFDLASLTKPVATATSVMILAERGKVNLNEPAAKYLPEFGRNGKQDVTVMQLLTHQGGLISDNSLDDYGEGPEKAWQNICALKLWAKPAAEFNYSDVGFIVLGKLVERVSGESLDAFTRKNIFQPLEMKDTGYLPDKRLRSRAATTERREGRWMKGEVHDPRSYALGGAAGHAGLFSTADDLAVYAQMLLKKGRFDGGRIIEAASIAEMTAPVQVPGGFRALGWDYRSHYSSNRGDGFSPRAFGHGGFTGTSLWVDPGLDMFVIFLSNRVHPNGKGSVNAIAGRIGTIAADAVIQPAQTAAKATKSAGVLTGIDILRRNGFKQIDGRRVGLITNQSGIARDGTSTIAVLHDAKNVEIAALFSPEHGIAGILDQSGIADSRDKHTGLMIYSLYGKNRKPTPESLKGIDTLVFDIQDIGCRFYTYISTMGLAMQAADAAGIRFVVLDRPNPLGGIEVSGPMLDGGSESFVAFHNLPIRHGMTVGELALLFRDELKLDLDLQIVAVEGWRRGDYFDATGLPWVNPSPNMRNLDEAILYPGMGLLETTNLSVGRGTRTPFELIGAPWLDGRRLAAALKQAELPGVEFTPIAFVPDANKYAGETCGGIGISITDRKTFDTMGVGLEVARNLRLLYPDHWKAAKYNRLLGNNAVYTAILDGKPLQEISAAYRPELESFIERRRKYLLYPE